MALRVWGGGGRPFLYVYITYISRGTAVVLVSSPAPRVTMFADRSKQGWNTPSLVFRGSRFFCGPVIAYPPPHPVPGACCVRLRYFALR